MSWAHELLARASAWLWPALFNHLWQTALVCALVYVLALLLRGGPARARYALWLVASAKLAVPSALFAYAAGRAGVGASWLAVARGRDAATPLVLQFTEPLSTAAGELAAGAGGGAPHHGELFCALTLAWLAGCAVLLAVWLKRRREFARAVRDGREVFAGREFDALGRARARLGLAREVSLVVSPQGAEPGVWRTRRPVLLMPELIAAQLEDEELEALMLHELVHVARRDNLAANFQTALACLFWFYPVAWLVSRRLLAERERACDERVLEAGGAPAPYAASILKVVRFCSGWRVAGVSGAAGGSNLRRRIEMIMRDDGSKRLTARHRALTAATAAAALALTVCAGLFGRGQAALVPPEFVSGDSQQAAAEAGGEGSRAAGRAAEGPAVREIMQSPEAAVAFENTAGAPLVFNEARMRLITREQWKRAIEEGALAFSFPPEGVKAETFVTLPVVAVTNVSGKTVTHVDLSFRVRGEVPDGWAGYNVSIKPGESRSVDSVWGRSNVVIPCGPGDVTVKLAWATFDDGTHWDGTKWGGRPLPPAATGAPTGTGATARGADRGAGSGVSQGVGEAAGSGRGVGRGVGGGAASGAGANGTAAGGGTGGGVGSGVGSGKSRGLKDQLVSAPNPSYPPIAKAAGAEGIVTVRVTVDEDGNVIAAQAVSGHPLLRPAAVEAARAAKFKPTVVDGQPVKVVGVVSYNFVLDDKGKPEN